MDKKEYKSREFLANIIQKIKGENNIPINIIKSNEIKEQKKNKRIKDKNYKQNNRNNLKINDNLSKEIQDFKPPKNINYEKSKYIHNYKLII
jgi:hypothetical protein